MYTLHQNRPFPVVHFAIFLSFILLWFSAAPVFAQAADNDETVVFVGHTGWRPFHFLDENGDPAGYSVELVDLICAELGWQPRIELYEDWSRGQRDVLEGAADLVMGFIVTPARREQGFSLSREILTSSSMIFVREETVDIHHLDDLSGSIVAAVKGSPYDAYLSERDDLRFIPVSGLDQGLELLLAGRVRALIGGELPIRYLVQSRDLEGVKAIGDPIESLPFAMAAAPENAHLINAVNRALEELEDSGALRRLEVKWFGVSLGDARLPAWHVPLFISLAGAAFLATVAWIIVALFNRRLRRTVTRATADLNESNRLLRMLSNCNQALVKSTTKEELIDEVCRVLVGEAEYGMQSLPFGGANSTEQVRLYPAFKVYRDRRAKRGGAWLRCYAAD